jgi:hypothetical protein
MKPLASSATQPLSQRVFGWAPVMTNTCLILCCSICPVWPFRQWTESRWSPPSMATISVWALLYPANQVTWHALSQTCGPD